MDQPSGPSHSRSTPYPEEQKEAEAVKCPSSRNPAKNVSMGAAGLRKPSMTSSNELGAARAPVTRVPTPTRAALAAISTRTKTGPTMRTSGDYLRVATGTVDGRGGPRRAARWNPAGTLAARNIRALGIPNRYTACMGASVRTIDKTYGHLARDSEDTIRARLDARADRSGV